MKLHNKHEIIMVDDNDGDLFLAEQCLLESSVKNPWLPFTSGPAFLRHLAEVRHQRAAMPALVLLDINMPAMTGLEVLEVVRKDDYFRELPIFCMLTSSDQPGDRAAAEELGANGFVVKPSDPTEYVAFFDSLL